jgi:transposase
MSSILLYRAFGFRQYQCVRTTTDDGIVTLHLRQDPKHDRCSYSQSPNVIRHGAEERTVRTVPIGGKPVELRLPVPRLGCRKCGLIRQAAIRFARPFRLIRNGKANEACELAAKQLQSGIAAQAIWDADHLATAELMVCHSSG